MKINDDLLSQVKALAKKEGCEPEEALNNMLRTMLSFQYLTEKEQSSFVALCLRAAINKRYKRK